MSNARKAILKMFSEVFTFENDPPLLEMIQAAQKFYQEGDYLSSYWILNAFLIGRHLSGSEQFIRQIELDPKSWRNRVRNFFLSIRYLFTKTKNI